MHDSEYWDWRVENAESPEDFKEALDGMMSHMVDAGLISMSWCDEREEMIFFMTPDQKKAHDMGHA